MGLYTYFFIMSIMETLLFDIAGFKLLQATTYDLVQSVG